VAAAKAAAFSDQDLVKSVLLASGASRGLARSRCDPAGIARRADVRLGDRRPVGDTESRQ